MLKYQQIATEIETYIEEHQLQQGDKLPVLETLMAQFEVSKSTITKSLELLEQKGAIFQVRGSGIFVRKHKRKGYISLLSNQGFKRSRGFQRHLKSHRTGREKANTGSGGKPEHRNGRGHLLCQKGPLHQRPDPLLRRILLHQIHRDVFKQRNRLPLHLPLHPGRTGVEDWFF